MSDKTTKMKRMRKVIVGTAGLGAAMVIAACGGSVGGGSDAEITTVSKGDAKASGTLVISNWPLYIDEKTVSNFEKETGVKVKYVEDYNDNTGFFGKLRPQLEQGESGGRSIIVPTDWMASRMDGLGYLQHFSVPDDLPNVEANLRDDLKSPAFDPDRAFSVP
jgi:spermidine/putrescine transport system substrate-binding protein